MSDNKHATMYCKCGCDNGVILKVDHDEGDVFLSLVSDNFFTNSYSVWHRFKEKLKRIWYIIKNREYTYFDICIDKDELNEFKEFVNNIDFMEEENG